MNAATEDLGGEAPIVRSAADATALGMAFVLESRPDGVRRFVFAGPRCLGVNGVSGEAAMADAALVFDRILPGHREAFDAAERAARLALTAFDIEVAMLGGDGQLCWRRFAALPRAQGDGVVIWDGLQIDVTERRELATRLAEQHRRLEMAVEATDLGFWEWDLTDNRVIWSGRNRALYGLTADEPISIALFLGLVHPEDRDGVRASFIAARDRPGGGDYSMEYRAITPAGETRWIHTKGRVVQDEAGVARLVVGTSYDGTERRATEERRDLLMGELAHRAKNGIAILMAIVSQTARGQETVEGFLDVIMARLQAMADSQDLVTASGGRPVALTDVVGKALGAFDRGRIEVDPALGDMMVRGDMTVGAGLLLYEMATNAVKYGALSTPAGRVAIARAPAADGHAAWTWRERGGPAPRDIDKPGFGTRLLQQALRPQGGTVTFAFDPEGFQARVEFPTVR